MVGLEESISRGAPTISSDDDDDPSDDRVQSTKEDGLLRSCRYLVHSRPAEITVHALMYVLSGCFDATATTAKRARPAAKNFKPLFQRASRQGALGGGR